MAYTPRAIFYKIAYQILIIYWFIFRPQVYGVRCLIECDGRALFVRQTYGKMQWTFPGGGPHRTESREDAARREVKEEVGITLAELQYLGEYTTTEEYKRDTVRCYCGKALSPDFKIDRNEIYEAGWFNLDNLPEPLSLDAQSVLHLYERHEVATL